MKMKSVEKSVPKGIIAFLRGVLVELDLVKWPSRQETLRLTFVVIFTSLLTGLYLGGLDLLFTRLLSQLINH